MIAQELSGVHTDWVVTFQARLPFSNVDVVATGSIREVYHSGGPEVIVHLTGEDSCGSKTEFSIPLDTKIIIH